MLHEVFAVYDSKADVFGPPILAPAVGAAKRSFVESCSDSSTALAKYPEDFALYHLGTYDDATGLMSSFVKADRVFAASEARQST